MRADNNHNGNDRHTARWWAALATLLFHGVLLLCMLYCFLTYPPKDGLPPLPQQSQEIVFEKVEDLYAGGEFVRTGDTFDDTALDEPAPSAEAQPEPSQKGPDLRDAGEAAKPDKVVSSDRPSPAKVDKKPKGPTKEQLEAQKKKQEDEKRQQAKKNADDATRRAFGGKGKGKSGQTDGNSDTGATSGTPGNGVAGRTLEHWDRVKSTKIGEIAIRVKVNGEGRVISATYDPSHSNGAVAGDTRMREQCRRKSLECRFSVKEGAPTASGTITWRFR